MKKIYTILVFSFLFQPNIFPQWESQVAPTIDTINYDLTSVFFINDNTGWAVGMHGVIIKTNNGGKDWNIQESNYTKTINKVFFVDSLHGWCIGTDSIILKTNNSGNNWNKINLRTHMNPTIVGWPLQLNSLFFVDSLNGWIVGGYDEGPSNGLLLKTSDGGNYWEKKSIVDGYAPMRLVDVFFLSRTVGWIVNARQYDYNGFVVKTTDEGQNWKAISALPNPDYYVNNSSFKITFSNSQHGWVLGSWAGGGYISQTMNGGNNWKEKSLKYSNNVNKKFRTLYNDIEFIDNNTGWLCGHFSDDKNYYFLAETNDAGNTWEISQDSLNIKLNDLSFPDRNNGWAVGDSGTVYKYTFKEPEVDNNLWKENFSVESNLGAKTVIFGQSPKATDGLDSVLGETELSPPAAGFLDLRFNLPDTISTGKDIRSNSEDKITWKIKFQPDTSGYPLTFIWNRYAFPEGTFLLKDTITGNIVNVDMKESSSYELSDTSINSLNIEYDFNYVPVELTSFKGSIITNTIELNWKTATETNNKGFEIERKLNSVWKKIGYLNGSGTSTNPKEYNFTDDFTYQSYRGIVSYRLKQIDLDGSYHYSEEIKINIDFTPKEFILYQNYPNPFNPNTVIKYALPYESSVDIIIYNMIGQRVEQFKEGIKEAGYHNVNWQPKNLSSGVYFYSIVAKSTDGKNNYSKTLKMLYMK